MEQELCSAWLLATVFSAEDGRKEVAGLLGGCSAARGGDACCVVGEGSAGVGRAGARQRRTWGWVCTQGLVQELHVRRQPRELLA